MKSNSNVEIKIYELLGVKIFKKMVLSFGNMITFQMSFLYDKEMTKEERKQLSNVISSNYRLGKNKNFESIKKFKKQLFYNLTCHTLMLFLNLVTVPSTTSTSILILPILINSYCIMLQRYNIIKINSVIEKTKYKYEKQKDTIKAELKKYDSAIENHTYTLIYKKVKETPITFDDLINSANIEQLKKYRDYLKRFYIANQNNQDNISLSSEASNIVCIPVETDKVLKLELTNNN